MDSDIPTWIVKRDQKKQETKQTKRDYYRKRKDLEFFSKIGCRNVTSGAQSIHRCVRALQIIIFGSNPNDLPYFEP